MFCWNASENCCTTKTNRPLQVFDLPFLERQFLVRKNETDVFQKVVVKARKFRLILPLHAEEVPPLPLREERTSILLT